MMSQAKVFAAAGEWDQAVLCWRSAATARPSDGVVLANLGLALLGASRYQEAEHTLVRAGHLAPGAPQALHWLGLVYRHTGRLREAINCYEAALKRAPGDHQLRWDRCLALLAAGEYAEAWKDHDVRFDLRHRYIRDIPLPLWRGEEIRGKSIWVYAEQGFGDAIMAARYLPLLARRGAKILLGVHSELIRLLSSLPGLASIAARELPVTGAELHCPMGSLASRFGTTLQTIPPAPYLLDGFDASQRLEQDGVARIGIAWSASTAGPKRSAPLAEVISACERPGLSAYSLQVGPAAADVVPFSQRVVDLSPLLSDFADTAAMISQMDAVVTVDTAVAHLAGAAGKRCFVLLPYFPEWRWLTGRSDSPWYPSIRLFRQKRPGDWSEPLREVREALAEFR